MKYFLLILCTFFGIHLYGQQFRLIPQPGKVYVSQDMEDLEILSDSTLVSSLEYSKPQTVYKLKNDSLFVKYAYTWYGPNNASGYTVEYHPYKIIKINKDTIVLKHDYHVVPGLIDSKIFVFVNLEMYRRPVQNFKYLKILHSSALSFDNVSISIDSAGKITYAKYHFDELDGNKKDSTIAVGRFSKAEFEKFKSILSLSMIKALKPEYPCALDPAPTDITLSDENGTFKSSGCITTHRPLWTLLNYLYETCKNDDITWDNK